MMDTRGGHGVRRLGGIWNWAWALLMLVIGHVGTIAVVDVVVVAIVSSPLEITGVSPSYLVYIQSTCKLL